ncbi:BAG family molecular chaperone regulator 4 [Glycine max]|nr:BAG family molecular chaperone regulator 4 [Glycine max]
MKFYYKSIIFESHLSPNNWWVFPRRGRQLKLKLKVDDIASSSHRSLRKNLSMEWEMRPGGMFVQRREAAADNGGGGNGNMTTTVLITVVHASSHYDLHLPTNSTFWDVKSLLVHRTGVRDKSKLLLLEDASSEERKREEIRKHNEMLKASEAVAEVRAEVDKLAERVSVLEVAVDGGTRVSDKEFLMSTELLMRQLLKLDSIEAEGEVKLQRKAEVRRVQNFVDTLDSLKAKNSNPFTPIGKAVSVATQWETFDSGMGSLNAPTSMSSSRNVSQDWERLD